MKRDLNDGHDGLVGVDAKCRDLKAAMRRGVEQCDRSLVFGVTIPDPKSEGTPDARIKGPRGVRLMREDGGMAWCDFALMVGYCYAQLDALTEYFIERFEDEDFVGAISLARRMYGDTVGMKVVPREWAPGAEDERGGGGTKDEHQNS